MANNPQPPDRRTVLLEAADRLHELRMAEREYLPATGLHEGEQELRRMAAEAHPGSPPETADGTEQAA